MSSEAKIAANRRNARRSTGPRSAAGKARTRHNAFRHGLAMAQSPDPLAAAQIIALAREFAPEGEASAAQWTLALLAAEAQFEIVRVRRAKVDLINRVVAELKEVDARPLSKQERTSMAFARKAKILAAFDRYERRALSRRNRALLRLPRHRG